ncbi:MAG TPA: amidohydrolase family protein [Hyphomicrobiaceae bacterium]|nr:amidohydrolase family protein [Hyphomicrobiaceae bacterium]
MLDQVVRNARLSGANGARLVDIGFAKGRIAAIEPKIEAEAPSWDAEGLLVCAGLIETHIHLDKSRIVERCAPEPSRSQPDHMRRVQAVKPTFTVEDIYTRAKATLESCIKHGATRIRTHAEIDAPVGVKGVEALQALGKEYAWAVDLEICVFPQEGLTTAPSADAALIQGLEMGARVIGAAPNYDVDHAGHINRIFELARRFDVDIDMHIDSGHDPASLDTHLVADLTERYRLGGRVAMGHATKIAGLPPVRQKEIARRLADVGVAVTVLPSTDLFVLARHQDHNVPRCVADANLFAEQGCNCSISTNNVLNPFTPFGDGSLIRMANLHANVLQVGQPERLAELFAMITHRSARLMNLKDYGLAVGNPADVVVIDAKSAHEAVATIAPVLAVFKRGRQTVSRPRARLLHPADAP